MRERLRSNRCVHTCHSFSVVAPVLTPPVPPFATRLAGVPAALLKADEDNDGSLTLHEFRSLFEMTQLRSIFNQIDADMSGTITTAEVGVALRKLGQ